MEVIHKESIICEDQINKFKNFKPIKKRSLMGIELGKCNYPNSFFL